MKQSKAVREYLAITREIYWRQARTLAHYLPAIGGGAAGWIALYALVAEWGVLTSESRQQVKARRLAGEADASEFALLAGAVLPLIGITWFAGRVVGMW